MPRTLSHQAWSSICELIESVTGPVAWRWATAHNQNKGWNLIALVVELDVEAASLCHSYPGAIIAVEQLTGAEAAQRLREGRLTGGEIGSLVMPLPVPESAAPQRIYGTEEWGLTTSGWPRLVVETGAGSVSYIEPRQPLLAVGQPFYPSLSAAVAERVFCVPPSQLRLGQHPPVSLRYTDRRGRIAGLEIAGEQVALMLEEGQSGGLADFTLRAAWRSDQGSRQWLREDRELVGPERIELATHGVPAEFVAVMIDPQGCEIDRRSWDEHLDLPEQEPESLEALVVRWFGEGEHAQLEYKKTLKEVKARTSFAETIAAFANGAGGTVLIGVDDEGVPVGYDSPKAADQVTNTIAELVEEAPDFDVRNVQIEGKPIVVVTVAPSMPLRRPHQVKGRVMVRALATTRAATPAQVRMLAAGAGPSWPEG